MSQVKVSHPGHARTRKPRRTTGSSWVKSFWSESPTHEGLFRGLWQRSRYTPWLAAAFIFTLVIPNEFSIMLGALRLSPYRIFILLVFLPCFLDLVLGKLGRMNLVDIMMFIHGFWCIVALSKNHGFLQGLESGGIIAAEAVGAYLIARRTIRSIETYRAIVSTIALLVYALGAFALVEIFTGQHILRDIASGIMGQPGPNPMEPRLGLERAFASFEHPILFGVFCSSIIAPVFLAMPPTHVSYIRWVRVLMAFVACFCSLSAGPMAAMMTQFYILIYEAFTRMISLNKRWFMLLGLMVFGYFFIDLLSNRRPIDVVISYLVFNSATAFNRLLIWEYGSAEAMRHPIFGIGFNDWVRPSWMSRSGSMDNFWLLLAVRYGMLAFITVAVAMLWLIYNMCRRRLAVGAATRSRLAWIIGLAGLFVAGATVHYWNALFVLYFFYVGSGVWLAYADAEKKDKPSEIAARNQARRRFAIFNMLKRKPRKRGIAT